jgi:hypothetical protein
LDLRPGNWCFADGAFDAVTISFGLRDVVDVDAALAELLRGWCGPRRSRIGRRHGSGRSLTSAPT